MRQALLAEHEAQRVLGSGLADRAGDRDDAGGGSRARGAGKIFEGCKHVGHDEQRCIRRHLAALVGGHHRKAGAAFERGGNERVAVAALALDGEERFAGLDGAAVDREARDGFRHRARAARPHGGRHGVDGP